MIEVIVLKQFQKFVKVKNGTPFKNCLFFYFMLIHHLSHVEHGVTIREREHDHLLCNESIFYVCYISHRMFLFSDIQLPSSPSSPPLSLKATDTVVKVVPPSKVYTPRSTHKSKTSKKPVDKMVKKGILCDPM